MKLHHIGILVKDIEKSSSSFVKRYDYKLVSNVIHDPIQTAFVVFLKKDNEQHFMELIVADSETSKLKNARKKGTYFHHLCYETENIYDDLARLESEGMLVLQQPVAAVAFPERRIAWLIDVEGQLVELVEGGIDLWKIEQ